ncbi:CubicO group peptidase (beta-lactamase class C family) [Sinobacterium caligoides]|uniref:CubicO group peptidase (Beta-lactamase class C family) n=1 Tax=Sinobacterium caligoides TaxID=933926 RepID=A0A3N2E0U7_9GAMM|nr:serine hydrolase domain-containing protein [Sinobacterium caligoides]ROS05259.1 CubicO group peptidase (beta-lactamase class C family) [Sinobacterium caligoides]
MEINGFCDPFFADVEAVFAKNFTRFGEQGAAFSVVMEGELVVNLWAGTRDREGLHDWQEETMVNVFSVTKGVLIASLLLLVDEGRVELDSPVADYWSEFIAAGKQNITVRQLLNHRAGLAVLPDSVADEDIFNWSLMCEQIAAQAPMWPGAERQAYHCFSYGWLLGELIRRIAGMSVGEFIRQRLAQPLGLDLAVGLRGDLSRLADVQMLAVAVERRHEGMSALLSSSPSSVAARAFTTPASMMSGTNGQAWRRAEIPAANGHASARSLAILYAALASGELLSESLLAQCYAGNTPCFDEVLLLPLTFNLGFMAAQRKPIKLFSAGQRCFGHPGSGGSSAFADVDYRLGVGYATNRLGAGALTDPRARRLIDSVYRAL